ncbi:MULTISPECIES: molecular chaperone DnaJ [unclassified Thermosipho (in: thermotogales)]|uniref:molecular chaperone DnaJ n=1 Tax=unclassified Thermosipho (in: thermotogales) TaxID=2676525 RepID=UPI000984A779|nr:MULTISPECIES: molecular chaperone DnaJ [unclassified Thermosipho (in: thermotogales)]MBT1248612.1 molecular chaperone DnaJ [Thermosipho sp. 1244]OOC47306.1 molecular chaperone DnaJ [Thermosipho sp. 1223]
MAKKDYYEILGVSRNASQDEIRQAYKKLIKKWHPDRNYENRKLAEEKFKEIQEAYDVLSDPEKRAMYDRYGYVGDVPPNAGGGFGGFGGFEDIFKDFGDFINNDIFNIFFGDQRTSSRKRAKRPKRGEDINISVDVSFEELFTGIRIPLEYDRYEVCEHCNGEGVEPGSGWITCPKCHGTGTVREERRTFLGVIVNQYTCNHCGGTGKIPGESCHTCGGTGRIKKRYKVEVNIPAGIENGTILRIQRGGNAGYNGGEYGDLYVHVRVVGYSDFERKGNDLIKEIKIDYLEAILGTKVKIRMPNGKIKEVKIPAGVQHGQEIYVYGEGLPDMRTGKRGDLILRVRVEIPSRVSRTEKKLLKEIAKLRGKDVEES